MSTQRMVAVCDILGFKKMILCRPLEQVVDDHLTRFRKVLAHSTGYEEFPKDPPTLAAIREQACVGVVWFSDTIFLYALKDTDEDSQRLIQTVSWLLFENMWFSSTRIRAGIAYGELHSDPDNEIFVGPAIVEAYDLEQQQEWSGGALTESAVQRLPKGAIDNRDLWHIKAYEVPLKGTAATNGQVCIAVDWTINPHQDNFPQWSKTSPVPTVEEECLCADIVVKWQNTKKFHDSVCLFHRSN